MVNYNVEDLKSNTVVFMQNFDTEFDKYVLRLCSENEEYSNIIVKKSISIQPASKGKKESWELLTNASFSIPSSFSLQNEISVYLGSRENEFNACIPSNQILIIDLIFEAVKAKESDSEGEVYYQPIKPKYKLDKVILSEEVLNEVEDAINLIKYQQLIYDVWGFAEVDPTPKCVLNFYGPPGTGKTMTANAIADKLGKSILALNYAEIESKYVGEAPKNLMNAFDSAKKTDSVLFFDEADSFLGKRIQNVTHGSDQALNSLRSQMLILLEDFNGVVVFATNLVSNFDTAFESRILKHIKFELPNTKARIAIIKGLIPKNLPFEKSLTEDEFRKLAEISEGFSGRVLKNAILEILLKKASKYSESSLFVFEDFQQGFEDKKNSLTKLDNAKKSDKERKILNALADKYKADKVMDEKNIDDLSKDSGQQINN